METQVKKKPDPKQLLRGLSPMESPKPAADPLVGKASDPLARLASRMEGPSALVDDVTGSAGAKLLQTATQEESDQTTGAPQVGGAGSDPLKWVCGTQAPTISAVRELAHNTIRESLELLDAAPHDELAKQLLDAGRRLDNEVGQFGALTSLAKHSGNWQWAGIHATGQLLAVIETIHDLSVQVLHDDEKSTIKDRSLEYGDKLRAGRQNFYGRTAPFAQQDGGLQA